MTILELVNLLVDFVFCVGYGLIDLLPYIMGLLAGRFVLRVLHLLGGIFRVTPGFLGRTLRLVDHALIGQFVAADGFADALFYFAYHLIDFAFNLILIHDFFSFYLSLCMKSKTISSIAPSGEHGRVA